MVSFFSIVASRQTVVRLAALLSAGLAIVQSPLQGAESPQSRNRGGGPDRGVYKARIEPHWFGDNSKFWYRNDLSGGAREFILVAAATGTRQAAFDHARLAESLSRAAGESFSGDRLPFSEIEFANSGASVRFNAAGKQWKCDLSSYRCEVVTNDAQAALHHNVTATPMLAAAEAHPEMNPQEDDDERPRRGAESGRRAGRAVTSPDGKWSASVREFNVVLREQANGMETVLTSDGVETNYYMQLEWSPDSKSLVAWQLEPGDQKEVYLVQSSPPSGGRAVLRKRPYALPGDRFSRYAVNFFDVAARKRTAPAVDRFEHQWERPRVRWHPDQRRFAYQQVDRGHRRLRVIEVHCDTGSARNIIDEKSETFIWTAHTESLNLRYVNWLEKSDEIVYVSEKDGWRHMYLVDAATGQIRNPITQGEWVVRGIDRIDEEKRQIWFRGAGRNRGEDPYFIHHYRVDFDGSGLVALTEGNGTHAVQFSPDRQFVIDTYSRVDMPPVHELRRSADGVKVVELERADIRELKESGWEAPEVFVAKGRDGTTDIWGIICRPRAFDAQKKHPVLEQIYAGPQSAYVPKSFSAQRRFSAMTDMGFIVVQMDGMGTAFRSKAFHDVCYKNLKDAGFADRILWHKAAAAKYPYYDIDRVGVYGTSAGGQNAGGAVLFHPEFYKAAVANCGCHDNRMDKASWNEQWMGYPVGPQYSESSNIDNAGKLGGALFLVVGEMDSNVPPESTLRFADALIAAGKDFDMLVVPGAEHGTGGRYGSYVQRRTREFFARHLLNTSGGVAGSTTRAQASQRN
ncbi:MAG TPA: prolyl oligopeptidase family serine peptidase [Verrucomicrobiae bacterium]|nr:prolyl oligopeptidase family serine peptidase [Verrucomicrobiae bacterium]